METIKECSCYTLFLYGSLELTNDAQLVKCNRISKIYDEMFLITNENTIRQVAVNDEIE